MSKRNIKENAQALLALAQKLAARPELNWIDANNAIYSPGGPFACLFPTKEDRKAFARTPESRQIDEAIDSLPEPPVRRERKDNGKFLRMPVSLHAALVSEAEAEGVSLNQLVLAKLTLNLQTVSGKSPPAESIIAEAVRLMREHDEKMAKLGRRTAIDPERAGNGITSEFIDLPRKRTKSKARQKV